MRAAAAAGCGGAGARRKPCLSPPPPCRDELRAAWAIFTPLLHEVDAGRLPVHPYPYGSRGPAEADELRARAGFVKNAQYTWTTVSHGKGGGGGSGGGNGGSSGARL